MTGASPTIAAKNKDSHFGPPNDAGGPALPRSGSSHDGAGIPGSCLGCGFLSRMIRPVTAPTPRASR